MKKFSLVFFIVALSACSSLKRVDHQAQPAPSKPGVTWGGPVASGGGLQKGFWCEAKGGILTFGNSGPTEAKATEISMQQCQKMYNDCKPVGCKPN